MTISSFRYAPQSSFTVVYDVTSALIGTDDGDTDATINFRQVIPSSNLSSATGNKCKLEIRFGTLCPTESGTITGMYFGQKGATAPNFTGNQVQVTFSGAGTIDGGAAKVMTSDVLTLGENWDNTKDYVFSIHFKTGSTASFSVSTLGAVTGPTTYLDGGGADTSSLTVPGNGMALHDTNVVFFVEKISISS